MHNGKVLSKLIALNLLLSYMKLTGLRAHMFCALMPLKVEGVLPFSPDTTLIVLIFSRMIVESDPLNWLPFRPILGKLCPESFQTQLKLHKIYLIGFYRKGSTLKRKQGKLLFCWKDDIPNWITMIFQFFSWELRVAFRQKLWWVSTSMMGFVIKWCKVK